MKRCSECGKSKPHDEFARNKQTRDGLTVYCRDCRAFHYRRVVSLDKPLRSGRSRYHLLTQKNVRQPTDASWERVIRSMGVWIGERVLNYAQADAILLHDIEMVSFADIAELVGCDKSTVHYHYHKGIERLRKTYTGIQ